MGVDGSLESYETDGGGDERSVGLAGLDAGQGLEE